MTLEGYRIVISIFRGTSAGRALSMMANGIQVEKPAVDEAGKIAEEYLDAASAVLQGVDKGIVFGMISIINLKTGTIEYTKIIKS